MGRLLAHGLECWLWGESSISLRWEREARRVTKQNLTEGISQAHLEDCHFPRKERVELIATSGLWETKGNEFYKQSN